MTGRTALLVGATGLVGGHCLGRLLTEPVYSKVTVLARRDSGHRDERLDERVVDFGALTAADVPAVDDVYCALGTTMAKAGSKEAFRRVDHDHVLKVAELAHAAGATRFALVSSIGADPDSRTFYLRVKGETERDLAAAGFECLEIFRPSGLVGERDDRRLAERVSIPLLQAVSGLLAGSLRPYRAVRAVTVARAMVTALLAGEAGSRVRTYAEIEALGA
ncbi:oxidoreductase [Phytomonospora sp. NPDC050363]|uniref:oxidoreductase n=1 Tax=Phytomonospora sp. NPDC050363 TaxID=3155642 RepID=UPI0033F24B3E